MQPVQKPIKLGGNSDIRHMVEQCKAVEAALDELFDKLTGIDCLMLMNTICRIKESPEPVKGVVGVLAMVKFGEMLERRISRETP